MAEEWQTKGMGECDIQRSLFWRHRSAAIIMLPNYTPNGWYESDMFIVTNASYAIEYEVKVSRADFKADFRKRAKHERLANGTPTTGRPKRFFYVCPVGVIPPCDVPSYAGLVYARWTSENYASALPIATVIKESPRLPGEKVDRKTVANMRRVSYYRFWSERFARLDIAKDRDRLWAKAP